MERRGDYGYDAPYALVTFAVLGIGGHGDRRDRLVVDSSAVTGGDAGVYGAFFLANALSFLLRHPSRQVPGLGRNPRRPSPCAATSACSTWGADAAPSSPPSPARLKTGRVTGIDLWSTHDQSGNSREVTLRNASLEGVATGSTIETGDMRALPFPDATFDLVVSSLAIHNIRVERRPRAGDRRSLAGAQTRRTPRHCRHSRDRALRRDARHAWRDRHRAPRARLALLVRQSVRAHQSGDGVETVTPLSRKPEAGSRKLEAGSWKLEAVSSLGPQGHHRINPGRPPRGEVAGQQSPRSSGPAASRRR